MFFESMIFTDYELLSNKHIIDKNRIVYEKRLLTSQNIPTNNVTEKVPFANNDFSVVKKVSYSKNENKLKVYLIKYLNPITSNLSSEQIKMLQNIRSDENIKQIKINTFCDEKSVGEKRLQEIVTNINPKLRKFITLKHEICEMSEKCNTTDIKINY